MSLKATPYETLLESETRFRIWMLLNFNKELNLGTLSRKLNRSKSTIHEHLQKLLDVGLIKEVKEEVKSPGQFPAKYYALSENYISIMAESPEVTRVSDKKDIQGALKLLQEQKAITHVNQNLLKYKMKFHEFIEEKLSSKDPKEQQKYLKIFNEMRYSVEKKKTGQITSEIVDYFEFFSEDQYYNFMWDIIKLGSKYEGQKEEIMDKEGTKPFKYYITAIGLPLKHILESLQGEE